MPSSVKESLQELKKRTKKMPPLKQNISPAEQKLEAALKDK